IAIRKRRPQPAIARCGHAGARALMIASAISWAQWLVQSVTGAGALAHTTVPSRATTCRGRNVPSFFGVSGSIRYARAIAAADRMLAYAELMKATTWGWEPVRSTLRSGPRLVTLART